MAVQDLTKGGDIIRSRTYDAWTPLLIVAAVYLALTMIFLLYNKFTAPKKALQRWEAGIRRQYGTDCLPLETEFYPHNLAQTLKENDDITVEGYSALSRIAETEHLLLVGSHVNIHIQFFAG